MPHTVLNTIVQDKKIWLASRQAQQPLTSFQRHLQPSHRSFYLALKNAETAFILECKKASPSRGLLRQHFDPAHIAAVYKRYATVVSVLTDEKYFQGSMGFLPVVSAAIPQPVLCKDFIIDPYQIYLARYYQGDAILLMLSVLNDDQYRQLSAVAHNLNMGVLTEVSNEEELQRAVALKANVVGINNRDLRDLSIDLNRTRQLAPRLADNVIVISESGIHRYADIRELRPFADGFLIGSALMAQEDLDAAVKQVIMGDNKVCGLTRPQDASAAAEAGAVWGGLIFASGSPRQVDISQAGKIMAAAPLRYAGVFRNAEHSDIVTTATTLSLHAVQLHGDEDKAFVSRLRKQLPADMQIWKAFSITDALPEQDWPYIDRYLLDSGQGGSGESFNWNLLKGTHLSQVMLAGGLSPDNVKQAAQLGCAGLDFNSGVETSPGIKNATSIAAVFKALAEYSTYQRIAHRATA